MKSKQLNFFMLPADYIEIDKYLANNNILVSAMPLVENDVRTVSGISQTLNDWVRVVLFKHIDKITIKTLNSKVEVGSKVYSISPIENPIVEFDKCYFDKKTKELRTGRIYFIKKFYSNNELIEKSETFISWSENLLQYVRKNLQIIREGAFKGFYASKQVMDLLSKQELKLIR